ncbi:MAG: acetyl-CoA C-acyltransferase, partial [Acetobacteraceae bacterium]|nr:acetyl-CoA C-acyltransferase [Acetobacteraceae bacterium]
FSRDVEVADTTIGWRFINPQMHQHYGTDALGITAENVAEEHGVTRADQDAMALRSQRRAARAQEEGRFAAEIVPVEIELKRERKQVAADEHPRPGTTAEVLAKLRPAFRQGGSVTAGNSSGVNDGAAALIIASEDAAKRLGLTPRARLAGFASAGVAPRVMGIGPVPATRKLLDRLGLSVDDLDIIELNEAFAAQGIAVLRSLGIPEDAEHVNPNGGAIALGHPLGMSGARLLLTATHELERRGLRRALCTMCVGVGQGISAVIERV